MQVALNNPIKENHNMQLPVDALIQAEIRAHQAKFTSCLTKINQTKHKFIQSNERLRRRATHLCIFIHFRQYKNKDIIWLALSGTRYTQTTNLCWIYATRIQMETNALLHYYIISREYATHTQMETNGECQNQLHLSYLFFPRIRTSETKQYADNVRPCHVNECLLDGQRTMTV